MDFINSPLAVLLILGVVAVAAVAFEPAKFVGAWRELDKLYGTERRPPSLAFRGESIAVGSLNYSRVDAGLDDDGFWIVYAGPDPKKAPDCVLIPWDCVRFRQEKGDRQNFQLRGKKPIELMVSSELGTALQRRSQRFEVQD